MELMTLQIPSETHLSPLLWASSKNPLSTPAFLCSPCENGPLLQRLWSRRQWLRLFMPNIPMRMNIPKFTHDTYWFLQCRCKGPLSWRGSDDTGSSRNSSNERIRPSTSRSSSKEREKELKNLRDLKIGDSFVRSTLYSWKAFFWHFILIAI